MLDDPYNASLNATAQRLPTFQYLSGNRCRHARGRLSNPDWPALPGAHPNFRGSIRQRAF